MGFADYLDKIAMNAIDLGSQAGQAAIRDRFTPTSTATPSPAVPVGTKTDQTTAAGRALQEKAGYWFPFGDSVPVSKTAVFVTGGVLALILVFYAVKD